MTSSTIIAAVIGRMRFSPAAPSGIKTVSAASGPYDAELSASRPKIGIARAGPTLSWNSSLFASGRPRIKSRSAIQWTFTDSFVRDRVRQRLIGGRRVNAVATKKAGRRALWLANPRLVARRLFRRVASGSLARGIVPTWWAAAHSAFRIARTHWAVRTGRLGQRLLASELEFDGGHWKPAKYRV